MQERKGLALSDEVIRDKARAFAATTTSPDNHQVLSSSWIEKFKLKNNLLGARSRKSSLAPDDVENSTAGSSSQTPSAASPLSPRPMGSPSPIEFNCAKSHEGLKHESPDSYLDFASRHAPFHSQSHNSLNSAFTDTGPPSFSSGPISPTSPFFTPDSGTAPSPFVGAPPQTARRILPATDSSNNSQRPRSQTFPLLDQYMTAPGSADAAGTKYETVQTLDSPMEEASDPLTRMDDAAYTTNTAASRPHTVTPADMMRPPPLPAHILAAEGRRELTPSTSNSSLQQTTPQEALQALEVVHCFFQQQPNGFLDFDESVTMGKLVSKLKLQSRFGSLGG